MEPGHLGWAWPLGARREGVDYPFRGRAWVLRRPESGQGALDSAWEMETEGGMAGTLTIEVHCAIAIEIHLS